MPAPALTAPSPHHRIRRHVGTLPLPQGESLLVWRVPGAVLVEHHTRSGLASEEVLRGWAAVSERAEELSRVGGSTALALFGLLLEAWQAPQSRSEVVLAPSEWTVVEMAGASA